jgi:hypothetical protein
MRPSLLLVNAETKVESNVLSPPLPGTAISTVNFSLPISIELKISSILLFETLAVFKEMLIYS